MANVMTCNTRQCAANFCEGEALTTCEGKPTPILLAKKANFGLGSVLQHAKTLRSTPMVLAKRATFGLGSGVVQNIQALQDSKASEEHTKST